MKHLVGSTTLDYRSCEFNEFPNNVCEVAANVQADLFRKSESCAISCAASSGTRTSWIVICFARTTSTQKRPLAKEYAIYGKSWRVYSAHSSFNRSSPILLPTSQVIRDTSSGAGPCLARTGICTGARRRMTLKLGCKTRL
jgi:hypothetical protein